MDNAYYHSTIAVFLKEERSSIMHSMQMHDPQASMQQMDAWEDTIGILKDQLSVFDEGELALEFTIPRINRRIDALVFYKGIIFVLEFKCGMDTYCKDTYDQVIDYAYDLHFFHEPSKNRLIVPIELPTEAPHRDFEIIEDERVVFPIPCNKNGISSIINSVYSMYPNEPPIIVGDWMIGEYRPTPTIIEAAQTLYREHNVENIKKHDSTNLTETIGILNEVISSCKDNNKKAICFVTGVPGAGKTLVGLTLAIQNMDANNDEHSTFLSGNGPLVKTLVEALTRDMSSREKMPKYKAKAAAESFIQNIFKFRNSGITNPDKVPDEHVVIFDEAQRAWNNEKLKDFLVRGRCMMGHPVYNYPYSEPESLIMDMDRHKDWAVIVCLVGGGQEIYNGEAGLSEWFRALKSFNDWEIYVTPQLNDSEYIRGMKWGEMTEDLKIHEYDMLHLSVSMRSLRSDILNTFVKSFLDNDNTIASACYLKLGRKYPIVITRNLDDAKNWVIKSSGDCDRYGMIASSNTERIIGNGAKDDFDVPKWFLDDRTKITSSYQFKYVASEFNIQGLELDYTIVQWGADMRYKDGQWEYFTRTRNKWKYTGPVSIVDGVENLSYPQLYLKNTYRVLLTRARKGMVLYIPKGCSSSNDNLPSYYDGVYDYCKQIGIEEI